MRRQGKRHFCIGHLSIQILFKKLCERLIMKFFYHRNYTFRLHLIKYTKDFFYTIK